MDLIDPPPNHPPPKIIENWNSQLIKLVGSKKEFVKIKNFLTRKVNVWPILVVHMGSIFLF